MPKSRKKKRSPKRVLALPDLEQAKSAVLNTLTSKRRPTDVRSRHYRIRRVVLFGAAFSFQPNGRPSIPDQSRTKAIRTVNDQLASRGCSENYVRNRGFRVAEPGTGRWHSPCEGSAPAGREAWQLAHCRAREKAVGRHTCDTLLQ